MKLKIYTFKEIITPLEIENISKVINTYRKKHPSNFRFIIKMVIWISFAILLFIMFKDDIKAVMLP